MFFNVYLKKNNNFMAPFYGWGSTASRQKALQGGSLFFTTKFPEIPGAIFSNICWKIKNEETETIFYYGCII